MTPQHQEKRGDIVASLQVLVEDVKAARALSQPGCASSLLQRLEHSINNYLHILTHLEMDVRTCRASLVSLCLRCFLTLTAHTSLQKKPNKFISVIMKVDVEIKI